MDSADCNKTQREFTLNRMLQETERVYEEVGTEGLLSSRSSAVTKVKS